MQLSYRAISLLYLIRWPGFSNGSTSSKARSSLNWMTCSPRQTLAHPGGVETCFTHLAELFANDPTGRTRGWLKK